MWNLKANVASWQIEKEKKEREQGEAGEAGEAGLGSVRRHADRSRSLPVSLFFFFLFTSGWQVVDDCGWHLFWKDTSIAEGKEEGKKKRK